MADAAPSVLSALHGIAMPGRHGRMASQPGVVVNELTAPGLATVIARKGCTADLTAAARAAFGIELPHTPRRVGNGDFAFVWSGPDQWLAHRAQKLSGGMERLLTEPLGAFATIVDQSHARTLLRLSGPRVREALAKGVSIDLHPRMFRTGDAAITNVAHIAVQFWQSDDTPTYEFSVARGFAGSFWSWLVASAAEFGLEFEQREGSPIGVVRNNL